MLSLIASSIFLLGAIVLAAGMRKDRRPPATDGSSGQLGDSIAALETLIDTARQESQRLEAAIEGAKSLRQAREDSLAALEALADSAALDDPHALKRAAAGLPLLAT